MLRGEGDNGNGKDGRRDFGASLVRPGDAGLTSTLKSSPEQ